MQWHQWNHMQTMCTSLQTDNHINTSSLNFCRPDDLPDAQPTVSKQIASWLKKWAVILTCWPCLSAILWPFNIRVNSGLGHVIHYITTNFVFTMQCYASAIFAVIMCPSIHLSITSWYCVEQLAWQMLKNMVARNTLLTIRDTTVALKLSQSHPRCFTKQET